MSAEAWLVTLSALCLGTGAAAWQHNNRTGSQRSYDATTVLMPLALFFGLVGLALIFWRIK